MKIWSMYFDKMKRRKTIECSAVVDWVGKKVTDRICTYSLPTRMITDYGCCTST